MERRAARPIVFLDVDGPLIPFGADPGTTYRTFGDHSHPLLGRLDPALGPPLLALDAELVWATTWEDEANESLSPILGFPPLPVVRWPDEAPAAPRGVHWKTSAIVAWAGTRPFAWIDDELSDADQEWIEAQRPRSSYLHRVDARVGLTTTDIRAVDRWLESDGRRRSTELPG